MSNKFTSKVNNQDKYLYRIMGICSETNRESWWLVRVFPNKEIIFSKIVAKGNLRFTDYGDIIASGFGTTIPPEVLKEYGFKVDE